MIAATTAQIVDRARLNAQAGRLDEAARLCRSALLQEQDNADALSLLGVVTARQGDLKGAEAAFRAVLRIRPTADIHVHLGQVQERQGNIDAAAISFEQAIALTPQAVAAHRLLVDALRRAGRTFDAMACLYRAIASCPGEARFWSDFGQLLGEVRFTESSALLQSRLCETLEHPNVRPLAIGPALLSAVAADGTIAPLLHDGGLDGPIEDASARLAGNDLLMRVLKTLPVCDVAFERLLTAIRAGLLMRLDREQSIDGPMAALAQTLAIQCVLNEYVFAESDEESQAVARLLARTDMPPIAFAILAAYRHPANEPGWAGFAAAASSSPALAELLRLTIEDAAEEAVLKTTIPTLTAIGDGITAAVRTQYEENPYPRWRRCGLAAERRGVAEMVGAMGGDPKDLPMADRDIDVLVAGCGTGQHSIWAASSYARAKVLAIDLSRASLAYAIRQSRALGLDNLEYAQADILALAGLERRFDVIECGGVLHHLEDPIEGWRVLCGLLKPNGVMRIALYSRAARQHVASARRLIAERGYQPTSPDIRRCRQEILALPKGHPALDLAGATDFYTTSGCRDLIFHEQEHVFTLPQIEAALQELGLGFLGFFHLTSDARSRYARRFPEDRAATSLSDWHAFEKDNPTTFRAMYQFGARRL